MWTAPKDNLKNIDIYIQSASPENIDIDRDILENIDIDKGILQNIDIDKDLAYRTPLLETG